MISTHLAGSFEIVERVMRQKCLTFQGFPRSCLIILKIKPNILFSGPNILFSEPNILFGSEGLQQ